MTGREIILGRLRRTARPATLPPPWQSTRSFSDLPARFATALEQAKGEVVRVGDLTAAWATVAERLKQLDARRIVVNGDTPRPQGGLPPGLANDNWFLVGRDRGDVRTACAAADVGISGVDGALAETGSVIVSSGPNRSRLATLLPPVHIAVCHRAQIVPDLFTWLAAHDGRWPANTILISGPSKTGDIEQTMAVGVHGPRHFLVILFEG